MDDREVELFLKYSKSLAGWMKEVESGLMESDVPYRKVDTMMHQLLISFLVDRIVKRAVIISNSDGKSLNRADLERCYENSAQCLKELFKGAVDALEELDFDVMSLIDSGEELD